MAARPRAATLVASAVLVLAAPLRADAPGPAVREFEGKLVRLSEGRIAPATLAPGTRQVALYFGAGWCGPCRAFVPELKRAYPLLRARGVEIVFVSDDATCSASHDYLRQARMPWPTLSCRHWRKNARLRRLGGKGLPGIVLFDGAGRSLLTSWAGDRVSAPRQALTELKRRINAADVSGR